MASEPKDYYFFMILTSNTKATENKVQFFKFRICIQTSDAFEHKW